MKKVLIHNFTRMGDLLQSTPLLEGIKGAGYEITLSVHKSFSEICKGFPFVDKIMPFDSDTLKKSIIKDDSLIDCFHYVKNFIHILKKEKFDIAINLSHSRQSAVFLFLLGIEDTRGIMMDGEGNLFTLNPWANYFKNMSLNRLFSSFNLVDVYKRMGNVKDGPRRLYYEVPKEDRGFAKRLLERYGVKEGDLLIGIQPGASEETRQWPPWVFADLIKKLKESLDAKVIIFGTGNEVPLGKEIEEKCQLPVINLMGTTTLSQLAALLGMCSLLVTNDTGTMHMAAAVGTKGVALFMGPALYYQTGPYGEGHFVIQTLAPCAPCAYLMKCFNPICKQYITPSLVLEVVKFALSSVSSSEFQVSSSNFRDPDQLKTQNSKLKTEIAGGAEVLKSGFDEDGFLVFRPLKKASINLRKFLMLIFKETWKVILDEKSMERAISTLLNEIGSYYEPSSLLDLKEELSYILEDGDKLVKLSIEGGDLATQLLGEAVKSNLDMGKIKGLAKRIEELDEKIKIFGSTTEELREFTSMFKFSKENLQGDQFFPLVEQTLELYNQLKRHGEITSCLIREAMELTCA